MGTEEDKEDDMRNRGKDRRNGRWKKEILTLGRTMRESTIEMVNRGQETSCLISNKTQEKGLCGTVRRGETETEKEEGGWVSVDKTTDLPGFPALDCSGEED